jgi:L-iditol 2-dehydrogenase
LGRYNLCPEVEFLGTWPRDGALARYVAMHEDFVHPVPDALSDESAALVEPLAVALWATMKAGVAPGRHVLVSGAGPIGLLCLQVARAAGATVVAVTDVRDSALERAGRLGASQTINVGKQSLSELRTEPDILLECSGDARALEEGVAALALGGVGVLVGVGPETATMPIATIRRRELTVTAIFRYRNVFPAAVELAASGRIDLEGLVTDRYTLETAPEAFADAIHATTGKDTGRVKALVYVGSD